MQRHVRVEGGLELDGLAGDRIMEAMAKGAALDAFNAGRAIADLRLDGWSARLSDGREFRDDSPELIGERSPWRNLEALARDEGLAIVTARVALGRWGLELEAQGTPLVCGQAVTFELSLNGGGQKQKRYRWLCRQETGRWVWSITDGDRAWEVTTPPGVPGSEEMPMPPEG